MNVRHQHYSRREALVQLLLPLSATVASAQQGGAPVGVLHIASPVPALGSDQKIHLGYELLLSNFFADNGDLIVERLEVFVDSSSNSSADFEGAAIADRIVHPGASSDSGDVRVVPAGKQVIIYVWLSLPPRQAMPKELRHRIVLRRTDSSKLTIEGVRVAPAAKPPISLSLPFRSGMWLAHEGPGNHKSHHWAGILASNGTISCPQRFAIDFIGLNDDGRAVVGDPDKSTNPMWAGYGADVVAVADGIVQDAGDGAPDNLPLAQLAEPSDFSPRSLYGNYVILDLGGGRFAHYAHLRTNSVAVKSGQHVRRGQLLGKVGNSGTSNGSHLHLHVSDSARFEESEGLPYSFDTFHLAGQSSADDSFGPGLGPVTSKSAAVTLRRVLPLHGDVVRAAI